MRDGIQQPWHFVVVLLLVTANPLACSSSDSTSPWDAGLDTADSIGEHFSRPGDTFDLIETWELRDSETSTHEDHVGDLEADEDHGEAEVSLCGNGECDEQAEDCEVCPEDCACVGCGEECVSGTCTFVACKDKECGDDGCGGSCGTCEEHWDCQSGTCLYVPWCGDTVCDMEESCSTCTEDCGACCGDGTCVASDGETGCTCPEDCGVCSGCCSDGDCRGGGEAQACGRNGGDCADCVLSGTSCVNQECRSLCGDALCSETETQCTCPQDCGACSGCCEDGSCQAGAAQNACGANGGPCSDCVASMQSCVAHACTSYCGDQLCASNENSCLCPADCGDPCQGKACGDDGCGGSCGSCQTHFECLSGACVYVPWCGNGECEVGDDCSSCPGDCPCQCGEECSSGACVFTACNGLECGDDGCGGSCGDCDADQVCLEGSCCVPDCDEKECGDDGCEGSCGDCSADHDCIAGLCVPAVAACGDAYCSPSESCWTCPSDCGPCCGNGACEPQFSENCGTCTSDCSCECGEFCSGTACVFTACDGLECGDDGCGGSCGTCPDHCECLMGSCACLPYCGDSLCDAWESCSTCPADCGLCCGNAKCEGEFSETCVTCPADCGCDCGEECLSGSCTFTACDGRECGPDGCDGTCGVCPSTQECYEGTCCTPQCSGFQCGDNSCGGTCGTCTAWQECVDHQCNELAPVLWSASLGGTDLDTALSTAVDSQGSLYVCGYSESNPVNLGAGYVGNMGDYDGFLVKYDADGNCLWSKSLGGTDLDVCSAVVVDHADNVYIAGHFSSDTIHLGGSQITNNGAADVFIAKYTTNGVHVWSYGYGSSWYDDLPSQLAVDSSNNIYLIGTFKGAASFGGSSITCKGNTDAFIVKYNSYGNHIWSKTLGGGGNDRGKTIAVDGEHNVYVGGTFNSTINLGGADLTPHASSDLDGFIASFDSGADHRWSISFGGEDVDTPTSVFFGQDNLLYFAAYSWSNNIDINNQLITSSGSINSLFCSMTSEGEFLQIKKIGNAGSDYVQSVFQLPSGELVIAGYFTSSTINLGGMTITNSGSSDAFFAYFDSNLVPILAKTISSSTSISLYTASSGQDGSIYIAAPFGGTVTLGGVTHPTLGDTDILLGRFHDSLADP